jgi:hypothetical protein
VPAANFDPLDLCTFAIPCALGHPHPAFQQVQAPLHSAGLQRVWRQLLQPWSAGPRYFMQDSLCQAAQRAHLSGRPALDRQVVCSPAKQAFSATFSDQGTYLTEPHACKMPLTHVPRRPRARRASHRPKQVAQVLPRPLPRHATAFEDPAPTLHRRESKTGGCAWSALRRYNAWLASRYTASRAAASGGPPLTAGAPLFGARVPTPHGDSFSSTLPPRAVSRLSWIASLYCSRGYTLPGRGKACVRQLPCRAGVRGA